MTYAPLVSNTLYYGDNLDVLRQHIHDESVDLIYLDPPFNSNATYNALFAEQDGTRSAAQIEAFTDTWRWDQAAVADYERTVEQGGCRRCLDGDAHLPRVGEHARVSVDDGAAVGGTASRAQADRLALSPL
jgi:DNA modification methylase